MAATQSLKGQITAWPFDIAVVDISTIDPGDPIDVALTSGTGMPRGAEVAFMTYEVTTLPTSKDPIEVAHVRGSDVTTAGSETARVVIDTVAGGNLTTAVVRCYFWFIQAGSGGNRNSA